MLGIKQALLVISLFSIFALVNATYLQITGPVEATLHANGSIYLGRVGPGQSFYIEASPNTTNATGAYVTYGWNELEAIDLPPGWSSQPSGLFARTLKVKVSVAPNAANGIYALKIRAINVENYSRIGNLTINAYVNVTPNVFTAVVKPASIEAGLGQPATFQILLNNTGASDDPFIISSYGLPAFNLTYEVIAKTGEQTSLAYPVYEYQPGIYKFNISITSATSSVVHKSLPVKLVVSSNLENDYIATGEGLLASPIVYEPAYAFMLLLSYLYKHM